MWGFIYVSTPRRVVQLHPAPRSTLQQRCSKEFYRTLNSRNFCIDLMSDLRIQSTILRFLLRGSYKHLNRTVKYYNIYYLDSR